MGRSAGSSSPRIGRREVLRLTAAGGAAALAAPAVARAQDAEIREWKMVTPWPKNAPGVGVNAQRAADMITAMSGGRIRVTLYAAGELVPPFGAFDAVAGGTAELLHGTPYYWAGKDPAFQFFTGVPFGLTAQEFSGWLYFGGGQALWKKAYEPFAVVPFYAGSSGPQAGGWFTRPIDTLDDLKGLKYRIAGLGGEVMRRLGAVPVQLPPGEIFGALQSGALDGAEWIGPWNDLAFGLFKTAKYYYMPAFHEIGPALELSVNQAAYDGLPDDLKEIVRRTAMASATESLADFTFNNIESFRPLLDKDGVELRTFSDEIIRALGRESEAVLAEVAETSALARAVYDSFVAFRERAVAYSKASDLAALGMRAAGLA